MGQYNHPGGCGFMGGNSCRLCDMIDRRASKLNHLPYDKLQRVLRVIEDIANHEGTWTLTLHPKVE